MNFIELLEYLENLSSYDRALIAESLFSLDCFKTPSVREAILKIEEQEAESRVESYTYEEVFNEFMEINEKRGTPVNLTEYLAERREWEYESMSEEPESPDGWEEFEKVRTEHALELLREYETTHGESLDK